MTNIIHFDGFEDNTDIRVTNDGRFSVYDVIKFCGKGGERKVWSRLVERYPEVVPKCHNFKFPGRGQRNTPVANRENILYIIGLLPGAIGQSYREQAAKVFIQYLDASPELAESVIDRATTEDLKRIKIRLQSKEIRISFTQTLQGHGVKQGWEFAAITNAIYKPIIGGTAKQIKQSRQLPASANIRDSLSRLELTGVMFAEELSQRDIEETNAQGFKPCHDISNHNAHRVRRLIDERE